MNKKLDTPVNSKHRNYDYYRFRCGEFGVHWTVEKGILVYQGMSCALCSVKWDIDPCDYTLPVSNGTSPFPWVLDHDHFYGKKKDKPGIISIRGYLCSTCNTRLGMYETLKRNGTQGKCMIEGYDAYINKPIAQQYLIEQNHCYIMADGSLKMGPDIKADTTSISLFG